MAYKIKSKYLEKKIKKLDYKKDRDYVEELVFLEKGITEGVWGFGGGYRHGSLRIQYPKEYEAMLKELEPEDYGWHVKQKKKAAQEDKKLDNEVAVIEREELDEEKGWWGVG
jgi:hypothetical protein